MHECHPYMRISCAPASWIHAPEVEVLKEGEGRPYIFLHGWNSNGQVWNPLRQQLKGSTHYWMDLPGFGKSAIPGVPWGSLEYAQWLHHLISQLNLTEPPILVGHSNGGRIALRYASLWPNSLGGLVLLASAGIRGRMPLWKRVVIPPCRSIGRLLRDWLPAPVGGQIHQAIVRKIASHDYLNSGGMRPTLVRLVQEDFSSIAPTIKVPTLMVWGTEDRETPLWMGRTYQRLMPHAKLIELPHFDHGSLLREGRFQVAHHIHSFVRTSLQESCRVSP